MPLTLASKPENYWILNLAIAEVRDDSREAPCPEAFKGYHADLPQTPPKLLTPDRKTKTRKNRSTRVPDFVQLLFQIKAEMPGFILDDPLKCRTRLLLIMEIKRMTHSSYWVYNFSMVLEQTDQPARHAFATYLEVNVFGAIIALGDYWTYREYYREDLRPSPTRSKHSDPTFDSEEPPPPLSKTYPDVDRLFGKKGTFIEVCTYHVEGGALDERNDRFLYYKEFRTDTT
ncbi:hypothetical protein L208DRAFT_1374849 [Tricholoma matsutake]|nr:hypothetical protein L208DRAFT_1374849 [Tricholoma matsutake 945]